MQRWRCSRIIEAISTKQEGHEDDEGKESRKAYETIWKNEAIDLVKR